MAADLMKGRAQKSGVGGGQGSTEGAGLPGGLQERNGAARARPDPPVLLRGWAAESAHVLFIRDRLSPWKKRQKCKCFFFKGI